MRQRAIAAATWSCWTLRALGVGLAMEAIARDERATDRGAAAGDRPERTVSDPRATVATRVLRRGVTRA